MTFYYLNDSSSSVYDTLSLPYKFDDLSMSFVHQLYYQNRIKRKTFGFYEHDTLGRVFYFGDIPAEAINVFPYKAKYKVKEDSIEWSINLEKVIYNNKTYNNTKQAIIVTNEIVIFAPNHFFDTIIEPMLNTYYQSGKCYNKEEQKIICDCDVFLELSGITFIIDRYHFFFHTHSYITNFIVNVFF